MGNWYEEYENRYKKELAALSAANISYKIDDAAQSNNYIKLYLEITKDSLIENIPDKFYPLTLTVLFPDSYPFFRPEVYATDIKLPRHQNIIAKNLCLIPRSTAYWLPETLLIDYLKEQLGKVLIEGELTDPEALKSKAGEQAEPVSEYYPCNVIAPVIFDTTPFDSIPGSDKGLELIGTVKLGMGLNTPMPSPLFVLDTYDNKGNVLSKDVAPGIKDLYGGKFTGHIYRSSKLPPNFDAQKDLKWLFDELREAKEPLPSKLLAKAKGDTIIEHIVGITFPEEIKPGVTGWGWLFIVSLQLPYIQNKNGKGLKAHKLVQYYAKVNHINSEHLNFRVPGLNSLADKKIVLIGLGALGGPAAIEFARNGVGEICILDCDYVDIGPIVRWPLGFSAIGVHKAYALKEFINKNYPLTTVACVDIKIGATYVDNATRQPTGFTSESQLLDTLLTDASLVFDASAETGINNYLSYEAKRREIPYVSLYATPGVWGGEVMRVIPNVTGCWMCLQIAQQEGLIPKPPSDPNGDIQPYGCGDISFTGTSFELQNLSLAAVRLAIATLCSKAENGYKDFNSDIGTLSLVDNTGQSIFPQWSENKLEPHINCPYCATNS